MDTTTIAIICAAVAVVVTPLYLILFGKGLKHLGGINPSLNRPIDRQR